MTSTYTWLEAFRKDYSLATGQTRILASAAFNDYQYIGIGRPRAAGTAEVYRRKPQDNNRWENCTGEVGDVANINNLGNDGEMNSNHTYKRSSRLINCSSALRADERDKTG